MKQHKVGETKPDITKNQALSLHSDNSNCLKPYIISKPLARIEKTTMFGKSFYSEKCWQCLNCKWESEKIRTRTT
jgi:hypothetical protein